MLGTIAAGCGGSSGGTASSNNAPWTLVAAASQRTTDAGTARFALTAVTRVAGQSINFGGTGVFDFAHQTGRLRFALPGSLGGQTLNEVVVPTAIYLQIPGFTPTGKYAAVKVSQLTGKSSLSQLGNSNPTAALETLRGASHDVTAVGSATIRGTQTTHYHGTIDVAAAVSAAPAFVKSKVQELFGQLTSLPFDAYIDQQGRLRRFVQHLTLPASASTKGQSVSVDSTFDLYDFGIPVHVSAPPASQTVDGSALLSQLSQGS